MITRCSKVLPFFAIRGVLCLAAVIVLAACGQRSPQPPPGETHKLSVVKPPSLGPGPDALRLALEPDNLESLDFFALRGCALQTTLGKYQSALGRGASDSQRLLLDLEYLHLAPACIEHRQLQGQTELANALVEVQNLKRVQLPAIIFNATLANTEFHQFGQQPATPTVQPAQQQQALSAVQAITVLLQRWLAGDYRASNIEFEIYLSEIARGRLFDRDSRDVEELHRALASLEHQLRLVLPVEYQKWQTNRDHFFLETWPANNAKLLLIESQL